jgi:hypothetical protein
MWKCPKCERIFAKVSQPHSCHKVALESHFKNKEIAKDLFNFLFTQINQYIGKCQIISLPCCVHLFGKYDFLAALPKKDHLEIRFAFDKEINNSRIKQAFPLSARNYKICLDLASKEEINSELLNWIGESYNLKKN